MTLPELEQRVLREVESEVEELVELAAALIRLDTTARDVGDPPYEEAAVQELLAERLRAAGASVDVWEPRSEDVPPSRQVPSRLNFDGRPQLAARFAGSGGGPSLLFNGHIDVVPADPRERWTYDPNQPEVSEGKLYGRGSCDMKGGVAAMVFAAEVLAKLGVQLRGDLLVNTVTDEESSGAGGIASVTHGVRADAAIVPEPTGFDVWVACRGTVTPTISILGRPGHAETTQPHWREGGAVNPIEKMPVILEALQQLRSAWRARADHRHPYLSPGDLVPTLIRGGEWPVTHPASCSLTVDVTYLPHQADERGWGTRIEQELLEAIGRAALTDPWLAENPPVVEWSLDIPPAEVSPEEPIVGLLLAIARELGIASAISGFDSWHDGATFTRLCGIPAVAFGPTGLKTGGPQIGHTVDEYVPVQDLVQCAQALALAAIRFCRVAEMA